MSFNNGRERRKFILAQEKARCEYLAAGMTEKQANEMYKHDLAVFNSNRRFCEHTQPILTQKLECGQTEEESLLTFKFGKALSVKDDVSSHHSRYWWVQEIESSALSKGLNLLSVEDLELLTLIAFDGYTQQEVAKIQGVNQSVISRKLSRIKKSLMDVI